MDRVRITIEQSWEVAKQESLLEQGLGSLTFLSSVERVQHIAADTETSRHSNTSCLETGRPSPEKPEELEIVVPELEEVQGGNRGRAMVLQPTRRISDFPNPVRMERGEK